MKGGDETCVGVGLEDLVDLAAVGSAVAASFDGAELVQCVSVIECDALRKPIRGAGGGL